LKDHQGNNRVVINQSGTVEETNHYYPFGGVFASSGNVQPYKYNGKELDAKKGLNWYDYGARHYDAVLGRFTTNDRFAEKYYSMSPYQYGANSPVGNIDVNWEQLNKANIFDSDFYLADLFVDDKDTQNIEDDSTIRDNLFVVYQNQGYKIAKENVGQIMDYTISIRNKNLYLQFWKLYKRPPIKEFQEYIIERKDLLVPQDIRERKGAFFTPRIWVELSQKYLTEYLGENWQDEYFIWDCAAGTGNLLTGLTNKYNIYASTLDQSDVNVMHERIDHGANLLHNHVFQFDFLNDDFTKLPQSLQDIINDTEKRKKLIIYINPPYAEVSSVGIKGKAGVNQSKTHAKYNDILGTAGREIYAQFLLRIYAEIPDAIIAEFSKLKLLQGSAFISLRNFLRAKVE
jgi:RHS repeat-associated protein